MERNLGLVSQVQNCSACPLHLKRNHAVPALPGPNYEPGGLAFMVAIPRDQEDKYGIPLIPVTSQYGRLTGGVILNQVLGIVGIERDSVLVMNRVRC